MWKIKVNLLILSLCFTVLTGAVNADSRASDACHDLFSGGSQRKLSKYDAPTVLAFEFTSENLDRAKALYHQLPIPKIVTNILSMDDPNSTQLINEAPDFFIWNESKNTFITVNPAYTKADNLLTVIQDEKIESLTEQGFALISWYVHSVSDPNKKHIASLEADGSRYLVTILDLESTDVAYLKDLKNLALRHVHDKFGANPSKDNIELYFHFPYSIETSTLHLHIRVNMVAAAIENEKSYSLDDVINYLESGRSIKNLILDRQKKIGQFHFTKDNAKILQSLGGNLREVPNPFTQNSIEERPK